MTYNNSYLTQGRRPYPFCHAKRQSDFQMGGWVKYIFIMMFCVTKRFQRKSQHFKRKNIINKYKKLQPMYVCFPFHHGTCTRRVFKFCPRNQSTEKGSHFKLLQFTTCREWKRENYVIRVYSFRHTYSLSFFKKNYNNVIFMVP